MEHSSPLPPQSQRLAVRRAMLAFSMRRQRAGAGSDLGALMSSPRRVRAWWRRALAPLTRRGIKVAVAGGIAANAYMPPRFTEDLDLALMLADLDASNALLAGAGWTFLRDLELYEGLRGTAWADADRHELDLIGIPGEWGRQAIEEAQSNTLDGMPTMTLPFMALTKLVAARVQDTADVSRMLGAASDEALGRVRVVIGRYRRADRDELEQMITLGRLEFATPQTRGSTTCRVCGRRLQSAASIRAGAGPRCAAKERSRP